MQLLAARLHHLIIHRHPWVLHTEHRKHLQVNLPYGHQYTFYFQNYLSLASKILTPFPPDPDFLTKPFTVSQSARRQKLLRLRRKKQDACFSTDGLFDIH